MIVIIDHGFANLKSIYSAIKFLKYPVIISSKYKEIKNSTALILPGVGNFGRVMNSLKKKKIIDALNEEVLLKNKKVLGICLGCQILLQSSEESYGELGLGWIKGKCIKFKKKNFSTNHTGWNQVNLVKNIFLTKIPTSFMMYFNHSFYPVLENKNEVISYTQYSHSFASIFQKKNIFGIQPHPEKSQRYGLILLKQFIEHAS
jgi:glutamine amidotransferase